MHDNFPGRESGNIVVFVGDASFKSPLISFGYLPLSKNRVHPGIISGFGERSPREKAAA